MRSITYSGTIIIAIHAVVVVLHGLAHQKIPVPLAFVQSLFVDFIIVLAPIAAMILLWTSFQRVGCWLLLSSMAGALLFGIYHHYIVISPDHVPQIPFISWGILFHLTAILLFLTEGLGCAVGIWGLSTLPQKPQTL